MVQGTLVYKNSLQQNKSDSRGYQQGRWANYSGWQGEQMGPFYVLIYLWQPPTELVFMARQVVHPIQGILKGEVSLYH